MTSVIDAATINPRTFRWRLDERVATITLDRPERKNPLTFEMYDELRNLFRSLVHVPAVRAVVLTGAGDNFCSGGDVHEIIGPLVRFKEERQHAILVVRGGIIHGRAPSREVAALLSFSAGGVHARSRRPEDVLRSTAASNWRTWFSPTVFGQRTGLRETIQ